MVGTSSVTNHMSHDSKDDTFIWEAIEMNNKSFDVSQQRDAPTKDCKGNLKFTTASLAES